MKMNTVSSGEDLGTCGISQQRIAQVSAVVEVVLFSPQGTVGNSPGRKPGGLRRSDSLSPERGDTNCDATFSVAPSGLSRLLRHDSPGLRPGLFSAAAPRLPRYSTSRLTPWICVVVLLLAGCTNATSTVAPPRPAAKVPALQNVTFYLPGMNKELKIL